MAKQDLVVVMELGSSKIAAVAGYTDAGGTVHVKAYYEVPTEGSMRHGVVHNVQSVAEQIESLRSKLENELYDYGLITRVYVGFGGRSLMSVPASKGIDIESGEIVTDELINAVLDEIQGVATEGKMPLGICTSEFVADHKTTPEANPVGVACSHLDVNCWKLEMSDKYFKNMIKCFNLVSLDVVDAFPLQLMVAGQALGANDMNRGCALIDYGAETVSVSVYVGGGLKYLRVIPMGSDLITKDLKSELKIDAAEAEELKRKYGILLADEQEVQSEIRLTTGESVKLKTVGEIIEARNNEIMANVRAQINASGYGEQLYAGIILTGSGSLLRNLPEAMARAYSMVNVPRLVSQPQSNVKWHYQEFRKNHGMQLALITMLSTKDGESCFEARPEEEKNLVQGSLFDENGEAAPVKEPVHKTNEQDSEVRKSIFSRRKKKQILGRWLDKVSGFVDDVDN